ncbi:MAG: M28 family peptidase [Lentisphaerae bacterium]|nr:M28 family peptidase [Lentisphaerota bacterium]
MRFRIKPVPRFAGLASWGAVLRLAVLGILLGGLIAMIVKMPGRSHQGPLPPLTAQEAALSSELRQDVQKLSGEIGERNTVCYRELTAAADFIEAALTESGYQVFRHEYVAAGRLCRNLIAETRGTKLPEEIIVVGAHYDSVLGCPGANDNASGVAALLALARRFAGKPNERTIRFVAFVNEEPPHFLTRRMGSLVYARLCRERGDKIVSMLSLETIGCYFDSKGSQKYPWPFSFFYPATGNFVGFVGNLANRKLVAKAIGVFRRETAFPSEGAALPGLVPGVGWSDHWSFWKCGYPGIMVTDTAPYRYPHYHELTDTPEQLDYERMTRVVAGLGRVIARLANPGRPST